jgi:hypothetical protein
MSTTSEEDELRADSASIPDELRQNVPRKVRLAGRGLYYIIGTLIVSGAFLALVIALSVGDAKLAKQDKQLADAGRMTYTDDVFRSGGIVFYSFRFDGETYHGKVSVPQEYRARVDRYHQSGSFPILFLPSNPSISRPYDWQNRETVPWLKRFFAFLVIIQWCGLGKYVLRDFRLVRSGEVAIGRVIKCLYNRSNGSIRLRYEFRDADGLLTEGRGEYPTRLDVNSKVVVMYLSKVGGKSRPYPTVFFRAAVRKNFGK